VVTVGVVDGRSFSRFFSSVRKKAFNVVRRALFGLHRSGETGLCSQTGQLSGSDVWPEDRLSVSMQTQVEATRRKHTAFTNSLVTAWQAKGIDC
jgi:hypothetical protein